MHVDILEPLALGEVHLLQHELVKGYAVYTYYCGDTYMEMEARPYFSRKGILKKAKKRETEAKVKAQNEKRARRFFIRLVHTNFGKGDLYLTLTYEKQRNSIKEVQKDIRNYLDRLKRDRKRAGLPPMKYIYIMETTMGRLGIQFHVHILMNKMDREAVERQWKLGRA
ncbi:hypothetical protein LJC20_01905, partial [Eubacteriales bacterium OttesenSCG-928-M02]|nr:hypothetical protein [Eubacteriales bacterium OttesenSCG-928-M02]